MAMIVGKALIFTGVFILLVVTIIQLKLYGFFETEEEMKARARLEFETELKKYGCTVHLPEYDR